MFFIEQDKKNLKIFFRLNIHNFIDDYELIKLNNDISIVFGKYLKRIVKRTGKHCQESNAFHNLKQLQKINIKGKYNYDIFPLIYPKLFK